MASSVGYWVFPPSFEEYTPVHSRVKPSPGIPRHRPVAPAYDAQGIAGLIEPDVRLLLAHTHGGLPWVAKLDIASFFDAIPHGPLLAALRGQVASRRCELEVAGYLAWYWQARWPDWPAATPLPGEPVGVPQGSPISGVLANVFLSAFDRALERAGIVFLRYLDDVTILAASPEALAAGLGTAMDREPRQAPAKAAVFPGLSPDQGAFRL